MPRAEPPSFAKKIMSTGSRGATKGKLVNCHGYRVTNVSIDDELNNKLSAARFESWEDLKLFHDEIRGGSLAQSSPNQITRIVNGASTRR